MKRGLKADTDIRVGESVDSYNRFPDEKGTESFPRHRERERCGRYNRFPDEKGTESLSRTEGYPPLSTGYNRFPDEKGTERLVQ